MVSHLMRVRLALALICLSVIDAATCVCQGTGRSYPAAASFAAPGVEGAGFSPGALDGHVMWVDPLRGDLFLFGGTNGVTEPQNALWRYNSTSGNWALLGGSLNTALPISQPSSSWPAGTARACVAQYPHGDALVVMGYGNNVRDVTHSAVWRYSISSSSWSLIVGQSNVTRFNTLQSTIGTPVVYSDALSDAGYAPISRSEHACALDDQSRLWVYGGVSYGTVLGDVWSLDLTTKAWTYWGGRGDLAPTAQNQPIYAPPGSTPSIRDSHRMVWLGNKLWMFGGDNDACYADLWAFDTIAPLNAWTFVSGAQGNSCTPAVTPTTYCNGARPCPCPAGSANTCHPTTRDNFAMWTNADDAIYIFGGFDWAAGVSQQQLPWDDTWVYNVTTQVWTLLAGVGVKGLLPNYTQGLPGGRSGGFFAHSLSSALIYLACGQQGDGNLASDLWTVPLCTTLPPVCAPPTPPFPFAVCTTQGWRLEDIASVPPGSTVTISGVVIVGGLLLPPSAVIEIVGGSGVIQSTGGASLNGTIVVVISADPGRDISIPLINAGSVDIGARFSLQVVKNFTGCRNVVGTPAYTQSGLSVLISVSGCGKKRLTTGAIIGIAVAGAVVIAIIVYLLVLLAKCGHSLRVFGSKPEPESIR